MLAFFGAIAKEIIHSNASQDVIEQERSQDL